MRVLGLSAQGHHELFPCGQSKGLRGTASDINVYMLLICFMVIMVMMMTMTELISRMIRMVVMVKTMIMMMLMMMTMMMVVRAMIGGKWFVAKGTES